MSSVAAIQSREIPSSTTLESIISATETAIGYLGHRTVVLLRDLSKIAKSPEALKYTFEGALEIISALQLYIAVNVSDRAMQWATNIQMVVSAWSIGKSVEYFVTGAFLVDCAVTKVCTAVTEFFFCMARALMVGSWLVDLELLSMGFIASTIGAIPLFGEAVVAIGASPLIDICFLIGILLLLVDRARAVYNGGYVNDADEANQALQIGDELAATDLTEQQIKLYTAEKKRIQHWVAWADVVNLVSESALLILSFSPLSYYLLGLVASSSGIISCVWDTNPDIASLHS